MDPINNTVRRFEGVSLERNEMRQQFVMKKVVEGEELLVISKRNCKRLRVCVCVCEATIKFLQY